MSLGRNVFQEGTLNQIQQGNQGELYHSDLTERSKSSEPISRITLSTPETKAYNSILLNPGSTPSLTHSEVDKEFYSSASFRAIVEDNDDL